MTLRWFGGKGRLSWLVVGLIAAGAVVLVLVGTRRGPNFNWDAVAYIAGARNLAAGRGYVDFALHPIAFWPPGFSATLALGDRVGLDAVDGARWLNAFALGALVVLTFMLACRHVRRVWLGVVAAAAVGFAPHLLDVFGSAWTEPVFCVLVVGLLLTLESLLVKRGRDPYLIVLAGLLSSAGFAYRYAGVTLLLLSAVIVGVAARRDGIGAIVRRVLLCVAIAAVLPAVIIARNLSVAGSAFGPRASSIETLGRIAREVGATTRGWVSGGTSLPPRLGDLALIGAIMLVVCGLVIAFRRYGVRCHEPSAAPLLPIAVFGVGLSAFIAISELLTNIAPASNRLLSPVFAPAVVLVVFSIDQILDLDWITSRPWVVRGAAAVIVLWLAISLGQSVDHARSRGESGQWYSAPAWIHSDLALAVRQLPSAARIYSNDAPGLYFASDKQPIYSSPQSHPYRSNDRTDDVSVFRREIQRSAAHVYLVWHRPNPTQWLTPTELRRKGLHLDLVTTTNDGAIYRLTTP